MKNKYESKENIDSSLIQWRKNFSIFLAVIIGYFLFSNYILFDNSGSLFRRAKPEYKVINVIFTMITLFTFITHYIISTHHRLKTIGLPVFLVYVPIAIFFFRKDIRAGLDLARVWADVIPLVSLIAIAMICNFKKTLK